VPAVDNPQQLKAPDRAEPGAAAEAQQPLPAQSSLQGLVNQVAGYGVGTVVNRTIGIVVACIYPILLSKDEYGRLDVIFSLTMLLGVLFAIGLDTALARFYYEQQEIQRRRQLVSTVFFVVMAITAAAVGILLLVSKPLALWLYGDLRYVPYFRLALVGMPFLMINSMQLLVLRLERRIRVFNVISAANLVTAAVIGISTILIFHIGAAGVFVGYIAGNVVTGIVAMWINRHEMAFLPMRGEVKKLLNVGLPLTFSGTALWLIGYVNRPILAHRVSADDVGLYAIASGAVGMIAMMLGAFRNAWQPFAFAIMGRRGSEIIYGHALTLFTSVAATVAVCAGLFASHGLLIINAYTHKNWSGAAVVVGPLAMATVFSGMYLMVQTGIYIAGRTSAIALTMGIGAAANLLFNFLLIPRLGILGAACATSLGHLTALIAIYTLAQRLVPIPYQPGKLAIAIVSAVAVIGLSMQMQAGSVVKDLAVKSGILVCYCGILLATRTVTRSDLALFWNIHWPWRKPVPQERPRAIS